MEDDLNVIQHQSQTTSMEDNQHGRQPYWKTTSVEYEVNGR